MNDVVWTPEARLEAVAGFVLRHDLDLRDETITSVVHNYVQPAEVSLHFGEGIVNLGNRSNIERENEELRRRIFLAIRRELLRSTKRSDDTLVCG